MAVSIFVLWFDGCGGTSVGLGPVLIFDRFGPPGIIRKSENGWDDLDVGSPVLLDIPSSPSSFEGDSNTLKGEEGDSNGWCGW